MRLCKNYSICISEENSAKPQPVKNQDGGLDFEKKIRENRKRTQSKFKTEKNRF